MPDFEYSTFPNIAGLWIEQGYEYAGVLNTLLDLNTSGLCICHSFKHVIVTYGSKYAWIIPGYVWSNVMYNLAHLNLKHKNQSEKKLS